MKITHSQRRTVLFIYAIDILFSITSILYVLNDPYLAAAIYLVLLIIVLWLILHTSIISDKVEDKVKKFEEKHIIKNKKN